MKLSNTYNEDEFVLEADAVRLTHRDGTTLTVAESEYGWSIHHGESSRLSLVVRPIAPNCIDVRLIELA